ncbi:unnamed protein product, partial [Ilex paraguariensis]
MVNIVEDISESTPIVLEIGEHSGKDMEITNLQNPVLIDSSQAKEFPYVERPVADDGETLVENPKELLESTEFMGGGVSLDDGVGLMCNKEPLDKGFYSDNDTNYHVHLDTHDSDSNQSIQEQSQAYVQPHSDQGVGEHHDDIQRYVATYS